MSFVDDAVKQRVNPLMSSVPYMARLAKILVLISEGFIKKIPMSVAAMSQ